MVNNTFKKFFGLIKVSKALIFDESFIFMFKVSFMLGFNVSLKLTDSVLKDGCLIS